MTREKLEEKFFQEQKRVFKLIKEKSIQEYFEDALLSIRKANNLMQSNNELKENLFPFIEDIIKLCEAEDLFKDYIDERMGKNEYDGWQYSSWCAGH